MNLTTTAKSTGALKLIFFRILEKFRPQPEAYPIKYYKKNDFRRLPSQPRVI
jgi:hypothetical protein